MTVVDRIEGGFAVCETDIGQRLLPLAELPGGVREGDVLAETEAGGWFVDRLATQSRREAARRRVGILFRRRDEDLPKQDG